MIERFPMKREMMSYMGGNTGSRLEMITGNIQRSFVKQAPIKITTDPYEKQMTSSGETNNVQSPVKHNYETLMKKPAFTSEEKFRVLDARDKFLRLTMDKNMDLKVAKKTIGVCPDMCPEKERVMREFQHQVKLLLQQNLKFNLFI